MEAYEVLVLVAAIAILLSWSRIFGKSGKCTPTYAEHEIGGKDYMIDEAGVCAPTSCSRGYIFTDGRCVLRTSPCVPGQPVENAASYSVNKGGVCVAKSCVDGYELVRGVCKKLS
jgi:hypothetical protein